MSDTATNLTLDLGRPRWLGRVDVAWGWEYAPATWHLLLSNDGESWVAVEAEAGTVEAAAVEPEAAAVDAEALEAIKGNYGVVAARVSCGGHSALSCDECPRCGGEWCGEAWCAGDCQWRRERGGPESNASEGGGSQGKGGPSDGDGAEGGEAGGDEAGGDEAGGGARGPSAAAVSGGERPDGEGSDRGGRCIVRVAAISVTRERRTLMSADCQRELEAPRKPWQRASRAAASLHSSDSSSVSSSDSSSDSSNDSDSGKEYEDSDSSSRAVEVPSGCHRARYVRLHLAEKQPELRREPLIVKEVAVIGLEAMVDGAAQVEAPIVDEAPAVVNASRGATSAKGAKGGAAAEDGGAGDVLGSAAELPDWAKGLLPMLKPQYKFEAVCSVPRLRAILSLKGTAMRWPA